MAKTSAVEKNKHRRAMTKQYAARRARLKAIIMDQKVSLEERFRASIQLAELPRRSEERRVGKACRSLWAPDH